MQLEIITPEKIVFKQEVDEVLAPTDKGQIAILPHHITYVTKLIEGELIVKYHGKDKQIALTGGFLEVANNTVTILADYAVHADEIDVQKAIAAQKRAEEILKKQTEGISERDLAIAQSDLRRSLLELKVANRRRNRSI